jgi:hypothetical protein
MEMARGARMKTAGTTAMTTAGMTAMTTAGMTAMMKAAKVGLGLALCAALGAAGCGRRVCPEGMTIDPARSQAGTKAFCRSSSDKSRAAWIEFYRGTDPRQLCPFIGGRPGGRYQAFHPGGARWLEGRYENGQKIGRWTQWAPDGRVVADGKYRDGQLVEGAPVGFPATCETVTW